MSPIKFDLKLFGANYKHKTHTDTDRTNKTINFYNRKKETKNANRPQAHDRIEEGQAATESRLPLRMMLIYGFRFDYSGANCK